MLIAAAILSVVGGVITFFTRKDLTLSWSSRNWPTTDARISEKVTNEGVSVGMTADGTFAPNAKAWREVVPVYTYSVDGKQYSSSRFDFSIEGWRVNSRYYEENEGVTVYYNPAQPAISVLRPGLPATFLIGPMMLIGGIVLTALFLMRL